MEKRGKNNSPEIKMVVNGCKVTLSFREEINNDSIDRATQLLLGSYAERIKRWAA